MFIKTKNKNKQTNKKQRLEVEEDSGAERKTWQVVVLEES